MRLRLMLAFFVIILITVVTVVMVARQSAAQQVRAIMVRGAMTGVDELAADLEAYYQAQGSWDGVERLLPGGGRGQGMGPGGSGGMMGGGMMGQRLRLADAAGRVILDSRGEANLETLSQPDLENSVKLHRGLRTVGYLLAEGGVSFNPQDQAAALDRITRAAVAAGLVAGAVSLLAAMLLGAGILRPVQALTRAAEGLSRGDLSQRVPASGNDELATLGQAFNAMAASLEQVGESRRAMTADIAHELRNPLAVQRAQLEALQDGIYPLTLGNLEPLLEQNRLLTRLVEDLRTLALADAGQLALERTPTDFPALVRRMAERYEGQASAADVRLELTVDPRPIPPIRVDPQRVEQIIGNLLSNALRYVPPGGRVALDLRSAPQAVALSVHDSGAGIPAEALPHIFERFYRVERSRSRSEGGTGLGLAIARQLAEAHGGKLDAANHPQGGAIFTLTLPLK